MESALSRYGNVITVFTWEKLLMPICCADEMKDRSKEIKKRKVILPSAHNRFDTQAFCTATANNVVIYEFRKEASNAKLNIVDFEPVLTASTATVGDTNR
jgi:hypothetical protein